MLPVYASWGFSEIICNATNSGLQIQKYTIAQMRSNNFLINTNLLILDSKVEQLLAKY